ncbi:efflux RND transporter periplasmic adaptor subunit [Variovorax saccharolyticus]|uniref:efflux RND transporter periplasmic adaptor subunit n=1 Tax=Variovorax saccharolyticus TaxID=3053516 RepID=UPI002578BA6F|nr:efflux RND transporter periplasmic adaptor subunit [Variovorax sp. J31P216]MDM0024439.1 efflux RND transporter periplasmic adaptor subunit [Variovorax sp. J31P216]
MHRTLAGSRFGPAALLALALLGCSSKEAEKPPAQPGEVDVQVVKTQTVPVTFEFVGQTESSQQVEIRARVDGFLERRVYTEGAFVKAGEVMFLMEAKPFEARLKAARAELAQQQARLSTARANLARVKPLVADDALAAKDLDDATGQEQAAAAAVEAAMAKVTDAQLNLGYVTITSPVDGISSFAKVQDGAYVNSQNSLLTYVAKLDPMRVNFSLSENESLRVQEEIAQGKLLRAPGDDYAVELLLADGSTFPAPGRITFADAAFSQETGTFLLRAELPNPKGQLRPGQFVRVKVEGFTRPNSIVVPQRAVQQGPRGAFVWAVDGEGKAVPRPVQAGDWLGDQWLVTSGLKDGERVVVDGFIRLAPGVMVRAKEVPAAPLPQYKPQVAVSGPLPSVRPPSAGAAPQQPAAASQPAAAPASSDKDRDAVYFERGRSVLDATGRARLIGVAATLKSRPDLRAVLQGHVDASGDAALNKALARDRAQTVRDALIAAGVPPERIALHAPADLVGSDSPALARRVDVVLAEAR